MLAAFAAAGALSLAAAQASPPASPVADQSYVAADGTRVLQQSIVVPAGAADVWKAFTTSEGFAAWAAPVAFVDFRLGGHIETTYDPLGKIGTPGNIRNEIVAFVPEKLLAIRNTQTPPVTAFDAPTFQTLHTVILLDPAGANATRVTYCAAGLWHRREVRRRVRALRARQCVVAAAAGEALRRGARRGRRRRPDPASGSRRAAGTPPPRPIVAAGRAARGRDPGATPAVVHEFASCVAESASIRRWRRGESFDKCQENPGAVAGRQTWD
ncbi:MAG: SRPBCC domain-containing protein [Betaproteobacteria bacterium]|nr:SRPBCC domain-containing protein [Betaproteobacteria bacterium]